MDIIAVLVAATFAFANERQHIGDMKKVPITISTIGDLIAHNYTVTMHCQNCRHSAGIDLERLGDRLGHDHSYLCVDMAGKFKCCSCNSKSISESIAPPYTLVPSSVGKS
jgi:hypothetical protein